MTPFTVKPSSENDAVEIGVLRVCKSGNFARVRCMPRETTKQNLHVSSPGMKHLHMKEDPVLGGPADD